jgi:hypothetical protein
VARFSNHAHGYETYVADESTSFDDIAETMKKAAAALRDADVPFALAGSLASWARGGPQTTHDLDFVVAADDAERAAAAVEEAGLRREKPPEEWLLKAWDDNGVLVDLIFGPSGLDAGEVLERAETLNVLSMELPVMALEDVIVTKVLSLTEHSIDYGTLLVMARALREQIDWPAVHRRTAGSPFADAYFVLLDRLGVVPGDAVGGGSAGVASDGPEGGRVRVEVTTSGEGRS